MSDLSSSDDETIEPISPISTTTVVEDEETYNYTVVEKPKKKKVKKTPIVKEEVKETVNEIVKARGRPKKSLEERLAKQVVIKEKIIYMVQNDKGEFEKAKNPKITMKELKKIELNKQKEIKEVELGKTLQTRKNGKIDNRSAKVRTSAQIEATRRLVEANKKRKADKDTYKKSQSKEIIKESVREVVNEPFYEPPKPQPPVNPYDLFIF
jgi:ATP-dependent Lon protease